MLGQSTSLSLSGLAAKAAAICLGMTLAAAPALAIGGGGDSGGGGNAGGGSAGGSAGGGGRGGSGGMGGSGGGDRSTSNPPTVICPRGQVWVQRMNRCVRAQSGVLPDPSLAEYAYALAKAKRYNEAIAMLDLLQDPNTPRALNYRGYATRKLGRTEEGIGYYLKSVALDPGYAQVREYLGEAYVTQGKVDLAKDQLQTIKSLCGTGCEEYRDLAKAIAAAPKL
jgi:tetratricopeptide (TPR) repeat protein